MKHMVNYWIFKVRDEVGGIYGRRGWAIFEHRAKENFWGLQEFTEKGKAETNIAELKQGDHALFYLVSKERGGRFLGSAILESGFVYLTDEQAKQIVHKEYIDHNQGVFLKEVEKWTPPLPADHLQGKVSFAKGGGSTVELFFQGSIKKIKDAKDFETIIKEHELIA
jgi:hypothetical protein